MSERAQQLGGEKKIGVYCRYLLTPNLSQMRLDRAVKGSVDLDHIKELRQVLDRMDFASGKIVGVQDSYPILVGPASCANPEFSACFHLMNRLARSFMTWASSWWDRERQTRARKPPRLITVQLQIENPSPPV